MPFHSLLLKTAGILVALTTAAAAQQYPTKPIRLIIPFPPGGSNDVVGRLIAQQLAERLGRQVIVDNRSGAGGVVGTELASQAPRTATRSRSISIAHTVNPWLYDLKGRYDPIKSFTPVAILAGAPNVLVGQSRHAGEQRERADRAGEEVSRQARLGASPASALSSTLVARCSSCRLASNSLRCRSRAARRR